MKGLHDTILAFAGGISLAAYIPIILSIFDKNYLTRYQPERTTWFIWSVMTGAIARAIWIKLGVIGALVPLSYCIGSSTIFTLSIKFGVGGRKKIDGWCMGISLTGIALWFYTKNEMWGLVLNMIADGVGGIPTIKRLWNDSRKESKDAWCIFLIGAIVNLVAVEHLDFVHAGYPVFITLYISMIVWLIFRKRPQQYPQATFGHIT